MSLSHSLTMQYLDDNSNSAVVIFNVSRHYTAELLWLLHAVHCMSLEPPCNPRLGPNCSDCCHHTFKGQRQQPFVQLIVEVDWLHGFALWCGTQPAHRLTTTCQC